MRPEDLITSAEFIMNDAEDLYEALGHYTRRQRQEMLQDSGRYDRFRVDAETLSDGSTVLNFGFRHSTAEQRKREDGKDV